MELAMDSDHGQRMFHRTYKKAERWRMKCNHARVLHRKENTRVHEPDTPMYGKSEYDVLTFTIRESQDGWWVYAEKQTLDHSLVEPIPAEEIEEENHGHETTT